MKTQVFILCALVFLIVNVVAIKSKSKLRSTQNLTTANESAVLNANSPPSEGGRTIENVGSFIPLNAENVPVNNLSNNTISNMSASNATNATINNLNNPANTIRAGS